MLFREHRGGYEEAMATVVTLAGRAELVAHCQRVTGLPLSDSAVEVRPYGFDPRNSWDTHIVTISDCGVIGFTDGPLQGEFKEG